MRYIKQRTCEPFFEVSLCVFAPQAHIDNKSDALIAIEIELR